MWQGSVPSRYLDELPEAHVEVTESKGGFGWGGFSSRFDMMEPFASDYETPGWRRARERMRAEEAREAGADTPRTRSRADHRRGPLTIEGELVAKSTGAASAYAIGDRVFHLKFGYGDIVSVDGNKLTVAFDKAGEKRVVDSYVERA
jgi:DNA helicase-2/ATP-dependent DNA helicase PcrA